MAGLIYPPGLGDTEWNEEQWGRAMSAVLPRFIVAGADDWKPTRHASIDRTVTMAPGGGWTCGSWDYDPQSANVQVQPNTSGAVRYDMIVSRTDWIAGTRVFFPVTGGAAPPAISTSPTPVVNGVNRLPLNRYDGIVAIVVVRNGATIIPPEDVIDARLWGNSGSLVAANRTYIDFLDLPVGALVEIGNVLSIRGATAWRDITTRALYVQTTAPTSAPDGSILFLVS